MKVILKQDVKGTGKKGQLVEVSDGYARNFLLARGIAVPATAQALNELKQKDEAAKFHAQKELENAQETAKKIEGKTVKILAKAGSNGKLFGSVTVKEVAEELKKQFGVDIDKKKISLEADIKGFGTFTSEVKLHAGVTAKVYVVVESAE